MTRTWLVASIRSPEGDTRSDLGAKARIDFLVSLGPHEWCRAMEEYAELMTQMLRSRLGDELEHLGQIQWEVHRLETE